MARKSTETKGTTQNAKFLRAMDKYASRGGTIKKGSKEYNARLNYAAQGMKAAVKQKAASKPSPGAGTGRVVKPASPGAREQARRQKVAQAEARKAFKKK